MKEPQWVSTVLSCTALHSFSCGLCTMLLVSVSVKKIVDFINVPSVKEKLSNCFIQIMAKMASSSSSVFVSPLVIAQVAVAYQSNYSCSLDDINRQEIGRNSVKTTGSLVLTDSLIRAVFIQLASSLTIWGFFWDGWRTRYESGKVDDLWNTDYVKWLGITISYRWEYPKRVQKGIVLL